MFQFLSSFWPAVARFLVAHWSTTLAVSLYVLANVVPRPDAYAASPRWATFWKIVDRLCFLTSNALPGSLKLIGALSPLRIPVEAVAPPQDVVTAPEVAQTAPKENKP